MPPLDNEQEDNYYALEEELNEQRSMHEDLTLLERSWDRQKRYKRESEKNLFD